MSRGRWSDNRVGPRSATPPKTRAHKDLVDPAAGEVVPRCRVCGMPDRPGSPLLHGTWIYAGVVIGLVLCERELPAFDPRISDPLQVDAIA